MKKEIFNLIEKVVYVTQPSPVVLISTISKDGVRNLAPFATFMISSSKPPMVAVGISPKSDTYKNILETEEFVVGIPSINNIDALYQSGSKYEPNIDEFSTCGFNGYESTTVKPQKILECAVNLECKLDWMKETGHHFLINANVVDVDIDDNLFDSDKVKLRSNIPKVYHVTSNVFFDGERTVKAKK